MGVQFFFCWQLPSGIVYKYIFFATTESSACGTGWSQHGSSCYLVGESTREFVRSDGTCKQYYASLATIDSKDENDFVAGLVPGEDLWIGYNNRKRENTWTWTSTGKSGEYKNWFHGQSNELRHELCAMIAAVFRNKRNTWVAAVCSKEKRFVCEKGEVAGVGAELALVPIAHSLWWWCLYSQLADKIRPKEYVGRKLKGRCHRKSSKFSQSLNCSNSLSKWSLQGFLVLLLLCTFLLTADKSTHRTQRQENIKSSCCSFLLFFFPR